MARGRLKLFANRSGVQFANKLLFRLDVQLSKLETVDFADGESKVIIQDTVRGCDVYLVQNCFDPTSKRSVADNFFEMLQTGDALKRAGASKVTAIMPYHPFLRQDKSSGREPLTARLAADLISAAGFDNVMSSELHAEQIVGFYKKTKIDNLPSARFILAYFKQIHLDLNNNLVVMAPDAGGSKRAESYSRKLGVRAAQAFKVRSNTEANKIETLKVAGLVEGHDILIVDDMIDTGVSMVTLVEKLKEKGAKKISICCTHTLLTKDAIKNIKELGIDIIGTDTIPRSQEFKIDNPWYKEVSLASLFAKAIQNMNANQSFNELYYE
ncbi:ribose-phosphate pyrophosphokinase [archaeon]|jgi:ribose-phosphate pyrophosphokinase|nr:ribose-phosphate pyrophosphokinase [archaeon]